MDTIRSTQLPLISPMVPQLGVTDPERTLPFYRDVLGFTVNWTHKDNGVVGVAEVQSGPEKIQFEAHNPGDRLQARTAENDRRLRNTFARPLW